MRRWTEGEGPLTAVSKQDGRVGMTQKARQLCPFYYWANSFTDRASLLSHSYHSFLQYSSGPVSNTPLWNCVNKQTKLMYNKSHFIFYNLGSNIVFLTVRLRSICHQDTFWYYDSLRTYAMRLTLTEADEWLSFGWKASGKAEFLISSSQDLPIGCFY